jgi:hypothetical protein
MKRGSIFVAMTLAAAQASGASSEVSEGLR